MTTFRSIAVLMCAVALTACEKNAVQDITGSLPESRIKFFNFGVNAPSVNFYANDTKVTAISSTSGVESTLGVASGGVASGGFYSAMDPGQYSFSARISATVDKNLPITTVPSTLEAGKAYSFYVSGIYSTATKSAEGFVLEDNFVNARDFSTSYVRFVNAISNSNPMTLYGTNTSPAQPEIAIGGVVAYKSGGAFVAVPPGVYNLATRYPNATTNAIARTGVSFLPGRVYTIGARGDITVTSTTLATRPQLDFTANR
jgi:hypothetical protein